MHMCACSYKEPIQSTLHENVLKRLTTFRVCAFVPRFPFLLQRAAVYLTILNRHEPVVVKLNSGLDYRGVLACLDGYMNIALEQTEEYVNGQLKNKYGDAFIRGNNVLYISTQKRRI
ncbi:small nuclear ribonucleoprotein f, putative [Ixodes scapularis]|uniref:Small nuclear ribonucleoprotein f, putative n=1 Tax=Ixodes scapularis TaxID=6945 RepID=B7P2Q0_IXOSC|nr:small nuclear ribonucleoprotein f, putative [Ixodes scapularis]|eukprot:XP_002402835.1 small nuclear ribonucleoprotein f, putative [Ixodes scapularis]